MRNIKFRAWDNMRKVMYYSLHPKADNGNKPIWNSDFFNTIEADPDRFSEVMQYTGFKDKNGKEIYEGDIVRDDDNVQDGVREVRFGEEQIDASDFEEYSVPVVGFYLTNYLQHEGEYEGLSSGKAEHLEVIGNIYENPELLIPLT